MTIQNTDLFLVQRGNNPYNVDFETIKESLGPNDLPTFTRQSFTATEGQTLFICSDKFTDGQEMVYLNGSHLARNIDYTTGFNERITLVKPANVGDFLELTCGNYIETNPSGEPGDGRFLKLTGETSQVVDGDVQIDGDFDVSGRVGIGTADPEFSLAVVGAAQVQATSQPRIRLKETTLPKEYSARIGGSGQLLVRDETASADRITVLTGGNVGLGVNNPQAKLDVDGEIILSSLNSYVKFAAGNTQQCGLLAVAGNPSVERAGINFEGVANSQFTEIAFSTSDSFNTMAEVMRIDRSGNVGIGTSDPEKELDIKGALLVGPQNTTNVYQGQSLRNGKDSSVADTTSFIDFQNNLATPDCHIYADHKTNGGSTLRFGTTNAGDRTTDRRTTSLVIDEGNVGIGTNNPQAKLDVNGDIKSNNVTFNLEPEDTSNYTTTTETYTEEEELTPYVPAVEEVVGPLGRVIKEGTEAVEATYQTVTKTRDVRTYTGPILDVKDRLQKADNALLALKQAAITATDFSSLQTAIVTALANI